MYAVRWCGAWLMLSRLCPSFLERWLFAWLSEGEDEA